MSILYLDEAGNSGLGDKNQPYLLYGGLLVNPSNWKNIERQFVQVQQKYLSLLFSRIDQVDDPSHIGRLAVTLDFFNDFHFHTAKIVNRTALWSKLDRATNEHFKLIEELVDVIINNDVDFFIGALKKASVQSTKEREEYDLLLPSFFKYVDANTKDNHFMVIWDDGSPKDREQILHALKDPSLNNCIPELVAGKNLPMLQLSDVGIWIVQYYLKLEQSRTDNFAKNVINLYNKLEPSLKFHKVGF